MQTKRGPEYARDLTDDERRTLEGLLARLPLPAPLPRPAPMRRRARRAPRSWRTVTAAGIAALLVLLAAGSIRFVIAGATGDQQHGGQSVERLLDVLADVAGRAAAAHGPVLYRSSLEVLVTPRPGYCSVDAFAIELWEDAEPPLAQVPGRLTVARVDPPSVAPARGGCAESSEPPTRGGPNGTLFAGDTGPALKTWIGTDAPAQLTPYANPSGIAGLSPAEGRRSITTIPADPDDVDAALGANCAQRPTSDCPAVWWTTLVELISSPEADPAHRSAALTAAARRVAARPDEATLVPDMTDDLTGRRAVTLRVPQMYTPGRTALPSTEVPSVADLAFDESTGALLQRAIRAPKGIPLTDFTVYRAVTRVAATGATE